MSTRCSPHENHVAGPQQVRRCLLVTAALCGLALSACANPTGDDENPPAGAEPTAQYWIEEHSTDGLDFLVQYAEVPEGVEVGYHEALIEGELTVDDETGCIGLIADTDGMDGDFTIPVFPEGTELRDDDTLYVPTGGGGELQFGDHVGFGGSETDPERVAEIADEELTCTGDRHWGVNPEY